MKFFYIVIIVTILVGIALFGLKQSSQDAPGLYDQFAQCLKDKGAVFYGASWCPHCVAQKGDFGSSAHLLPYVECSTSGDKQAQECEDAQITGYPTWIFPDGSRETGSQSFETLAEKTGCTLPKK